MRLDSEGGTQVGNALTGDSELGDLTKAEKDYLAQEAVKAWDGQAKDNGGRRENIREAVNEVRDDPAASSALAEALARPALEEDKSIAAAGAISGPQGMTERHGEMFYAAAELDLDAVVGSYGGNEVALAQRLASASPETRGQMWEMLSEPGRVPEESQQAMTTALFFLDDGAKDASPEYRQNMAEAIALTRRPGNEPADRLARDMMATNIAAVMETGDGRDMLLGPENTDSARLWALNEVASATGRIDPESYAGFDAPSLVDRPGHPNAVGTGDIASEGEVIADLTQMALDISGIADPTPVSDGANTLISLFRGDVGGALISAAGLVPYVGDLAKVGKLGKWVQTMEKAVDLAGRSEKFMETVRPMLEGISGAIKSIGDDVMKTLPQPAQDALRNIGRKVDDALQAAARRAPLVVDDAIGTTKNVDGRTLTIGDGPAVNARPDGKREALTVDGDVVTLREPKAGVTDVKNNPDGTVTYTKNGQELQYDADGFPIFDSKADIYLDASHINSGADAAHFKAANEQVASALEADPSLAQKMGLTDAQVAFFKEGKDFDQSPPDLTWHHHQDTGKMQLVDREIHNNFPHTGGMATWGGGRN
ncbi:HNH endonuclease [Paracoccus alkanivorans]|nr:HNH endonuclease [Paracoccus alkanivorans]